MTAVYRVGTSVFVLEMASGSAGWVASAWRLGDDDRLARVHEPDGRPFEASGPSAWQAQLRATSRLEGFLRERAYERRDVEVQAWERAGTWRLPA